MSRSLRFARLSPVPYTVLLLFFLAAPAWAITASNVLVLYNDASADGRQIADYYASVHPGAQLLGLHDVPTTEEVSWDVYLNTIRPQVTAALNGNLGVIVTTKGLPLRINNPNVDPSTYSAWSQYSSLESELTRVDTFATRIQMGNQKYNQAPPRGNPAVSNPYFKAKAPFDYNTYKIRLTSRLDGFDVSDVEKAIDGAQHAVYNRPGYTYVLDDSPTAPAAGVDKMESLRDTVLAPRGLSTFYDGTSAYQRQAPGAAIGYVTHGTNGGAPSDYLSRSADGIAFPIAPGAVFCSYESYNAYTFDRATAVPCNQGTLAQWIALGGSAAVGNVYEPNVSSLNVTNEDRMFDMLLNGSTWAEAAWNATYQLSYVNTVVGDPLMTFRPWLKGDCNNDGGVDVLDLGIVASEYDQTGQGLAGDLNGDGIVDVTDLAILSTAWFGNESGSLSPVPEPAALSLLALSLPLLRRKR